MALFVIPVMKTEAMTIEFVSMPLFWKYRVIHGKMLQRRFSREMILSLDYSEDGLEVVEKEQQVQS